MLRGFRYADCGPDPANLELGTWNLERHKENGPGRFPGRFVYGVPNGI